ncbi:HEAT repeat domain-containing protein [Aporhodopirellula aestuarii]|uniref:HEAT repeat domain-containing protein n=1 Tax=Aporhodopirellula aestuarii TaxID=2950107 RepID=UPI002AFF0101|nr:HEAT repeat domain-containing protein [Aporhodopirellula aestuarii]
MLLDLLNDRDSGIRTRALATLGKIKRQPDIVVPALIPLLNDEHANVRWHAAFALGQFGKEAQGGIQSLAAQMNDDLSPIATFAAITLRQIDDTIATEARLIDLLSNPIGQNRDRAMKALVDLETPTALDVLVRRYRNEDDPKLRDRIARTIAKLDENVNRNTATPQHQAGNRNGEATRIKNGQSVIAARLRWPVFRLRSTTSSKLLPLSILLQAIVTRNPSVNKCIHKDQPLSPL